MSETFKLFQKAVDNQITKGAARDAHRVKKDEDEYELDGLIRVHASELGRCPIYLHKLVSGEIRGRRRPPGRGKRLFLEDGFLHERGLLGKLADAGIRAAPGMPMPPIPVKDTKLVIVGTPDIMLWEKKSFAHDEAKYVIEHKAVSDEVFKMYRDAPDLIPWYYIVQVCSYVKAFGLLEGLLVFKNRATAEYNPDPFSALDMSVDSAGLVWSRSDAEDVFDNAVLTLALASKGDEELLKPRIFGSECGFCPLKSTCFGKVMGKASFKGNDSIELGDKDKELSQAIKDVRELGHEIKELQAKEKYLKGRVHDFMEEGGIRRIRGAAGRATMVFSTSRATPNKGDVQKCIADGLIRVSEPKPYSYVRFDAPKGE